MTEAEIKEQLTEFVFDILSKLEEEFFTNLTKDCIQVIIKTIFSNILKKIMEDGERVRKKKAKSIENVVIKDDYIEEMFTQFIIDYESIPTDIDNMLSIIIADFDEEFDNGMVGTECVNVVEKPVEQSKKRKRD